MVTISDGKYFSLGLDLEVVANADHTELTQYVVDLHKMYCRLLTFPLVTVAAANGKGNEQCSSYFPIFKTQCTLTLIPLFSLTRSATFKSV